MKIKSFEIENYRSLKYIKIEEFEISTIFYGLNNAGKSNILNALHLIFKRKQKLSGETLSALENFHSGVLPDFGNNYFKNSSVEIKFTVVVEINSKNLEIDSGISSFFPKPDNYLFTFAGTISKQEPIEYNYSEIKMTQVVVGSKKIYEQGKRGFFYFPTIDKMRKNQAQLNESFTRLLDVFNDCVSIIPSERDILDTKSSDAKFSSLNSRSFKKFLYDLYLSPNKYQLFEKIDDTFSKAPFNYGRISFSEDKEMLEIMIKESDFRLPIKHLGSGVMQSLFIVTSIICSRSRIICIEELEQNLSPKMQYQILQKIQQLISDSQFDQLILSSHSSVYSKPKLGVIYFLEKTNGETVIYKKEAKELSKKLKEHLAETQIVFTDKDLKELQEFLKKEHDFK